MKPSRTAVVFSALLYCFAGFYCFTPRASAGEQKVQYFPQFADGGGYATTWYFTGYGSEPSSIDIEIYDKNGFRQSLATDQGTSSIFHLPLNGYLASFNTPTNEPDARVQQQRAGAGFTVGPYSYINRMKATQATTFALRSINYRTSDVLVAFRVVRFDTDGSAILVWKLLQTYPVPKLQ